MPDPLLSSLCSICHVKPHKYRCPRCSALTCSFPCIKRHKQWAQCSGRRDPTIYVKQKDLTTPKGIDHDYNYLTSIEREIDHAEKKVTSRGVILEELNGKSNKNKKKGEVNLEAALERCGVVIVRAPKGMTRSKLNRTSVTRKLKKLEWTVEWVHPDGRKTLGRCLEDQPVAEAYKGQVKALDLDRPKKRQKLNFERNGSFSKNTTISTGHFLDPSQFTGHELSSKSYEVIGQQDIAEDPSDEAIRRNHEEARSETAAGKEDNEIKMVPQEIASQLHERPPEQGIPDKESLNENGPSAGLMSVSKQSSPVVSTAPLPTTSKPTRPASTMGLAFYLHHPSLPSKHPVLIPLSPESVLATSLTNRLVLEFPTIYVLPQQQDGKLPECFISEEEFFATAKKELVQQVIDGEDLTANIHVAEHQDKGGLEDGEVNEGRLLEVLGQDLRAGSG